MRIVVALGGNAISEPGTQGDIEDQFAHSRQTAAPLADLALAGHTVCVTHGNGPQVGNILRRVELAQGTVYPIPLHLCVADTQAGMGFMIAQCLMNELATRGLERAVSTLVTTVEVSASDPAFQNPQKPIGIRYTPEQARRHRDEDGWQLSEVEAESWRRVVPSPAPLAILEMPVIRRLAEAGELLVCAGGGGIPVRRAPGPGGDAPRFYGVEAVIDKDRTSALLARGLEADLLVLATAVDFVYEGYGTPDARPIPRLTAAEVRERLAAGAFPLGSMAPKLEAAASFVEGAGAAGRRAVITSLQGLLAAVEGGPGTWVVAG